MIERFAQVLFYPLPSPLTIIARIRYFVRILVDKAVHKGHLTWKFIYFLLTYTHTQICQQIKRFFYSLSCELITSIYILIVLYSHDHDQLYKHKCICMQNHNDDTIKMSNTVLLEKYTSHFIERFVCERELETEQNCNILTPTLVAISVSFPFSRVALWVLVFSTVSYL